jgi:hypothetical protein
MPAEFFAIQEGKQYLCSRPRAAADPVPVTLLVPIFAEFVDDCQNHQPTADDNKFVQQLSEQMCQHYANESLRMYAFRQLLRDIGIELEASAVDRTKCTTDGHLMSPCGKFALVIAEGKNERRLCSTTASLQKVGTGTPQSSNSSSPVYISLSSVSSFLLVYC